MTGRTVMIISDVHTKYGVINNQIRHAEEFCGGTVEQVFVLGDFGFYGDDMYHYFRRCRHRFLRPTATIEGNHEDHGALPGLVERFADVVDYRPRGFLHRLGAWNGLCLGGARYMDAGSTPRGCEISGADVDACLSHRPDAVDCVLTHDCPTGIGVPGEPGMRHYGPPGVPQMVCLAARYNPRWWFFGHHHRWFDAVKDGTRYVGLPRSWHGYVLLHENGAIDLVDSEVPVVNRPWWRVIGRGKC